MTALVDTTEIGYGNAMRGMFAARKAVFVDLLGWDVPVLDGRFEIDQFDDEHARYLIVTDDSQGHLASARLLPTCRPHILDSLFPALCAGPVPRGPSIFEITRFCLDRSLSASGRRDARNRLVTALIDHALANGISTYTGVADSAWLAQILKFGWDAAPLGQFLPEGRQLAALRIHITAATPSLLAGTRMWSPIRTQAAKTLADCGYAPAEIASARLEIAALPSTEETEAELQAQLSKGSEFMLVDLTLWEAVRLRLHLTPKAVDHGDAEMDYKGLKIRRSAAG